MKLAFTCFNNLNYLFVDTLANALNVLEFLFVSFNNGAHTFRKAPYYKRSIPVRAHPEGVIVLYLQQVCYFCIFHKLIPIYPTDSARQGCFSGQYGFKSLSSFFSYTALS